MTPGARAREQAEEDSTAPLVVKFSASGAEVLHMDYRYLLTALITAALMFGAYSLGASADSKGADDNYGCDYLIGELEQTLCIAGKGTNVDNDSVVRP